jgi:hypothetical protein
MSTLPILLMTGCWDYIPGRGFQQIMEPTQLMEI